MSDERNISLERSNREINSKYNANDSIYRRSTPITEPIASRIFASREEIERMSNILMSSDMKAYEKNKQYLNETANVFKTYKKLSEDVNVIYEKFIRATSGNEVNTSEELKEILLNGNSVPNLDYYISENGYVKDEILPSLKTQYDEKVDEIDSRINDNIVETAESVDLNNIDVDINLLDYLGTILHEVDNTDSAYKKYQFETSVKSLSQIDGYKFKIVGSDNIKEVYVNDELTTDSEFVPKLGNTVYTILSDGDLTSLNITNVTGFKFNFHKIVKALSVIGNNEALDNLEGVYIDNSESFHVMESDAINKNESKNIFKINRNKYRNISSITEPADVIDVFVKNGDGDNLFITTKSKETSFINDPLNNNPEMPYIIKSDKDKIGSIRLSNIKGVYKEKNKGKEQNIHGQKVAEDIHIKTEEVGVITELDRVGNDGEITNDFNIINKISTDVTRIKKIDSDNLSIVEFSGVSVPPEWSGSGETVDKANWDSVMFVTNGSGLRWYKSEISSYTYNETSDTWTVVVASTTYKNCKAIRTNDPVLLYRQIDEYRNKGTSQLSELMYNLNDIEDYICRIDSSTSSDVSLRRYDPLNLNTTKNVRFPVTNPSLITISHSDLITIGSKVECKDNVFGFVTSIDIVKRVLSIYVPSESKYYTRSFDTFGNSIKYSYLKVSGYESKTVSSVSLYSTDGSDVLNGDIYKVKFTDNTTVNVNISAFNWVDKEIDESDYVFGYALNATSDVTDKTQYQKNSNFCLKSEIAYIRRSHFSTKLFITVGSNSYAKTAFKNLASGYIDEKYFYDAADIKGYYGYGYNYAVDNYVYAVADSYTNKGNVYRNSSNLLITYTSASTTVQVQNALILNRPCVVENPDSIDSTYYGILTGTGTNSLIINANGTNYTLTTSGANTYYDNTVAYVDTGVSALSIATQDQLINPIAVNATTNEATANLIFNGTKYRAKITKSAITFKSDVAIVTNKTNGTSVLGPNVTKYSLNSSKALQITVGTTVHTNLNILKLGAAVLHKDPRYAFNQFMFEPLIIKSVSTSGVSGVYYNSVKKTNTTVSVSNIAISRLGIPYDSKTFFTSDSVASKITSINKDAKTVTFANNVTISYYAYSNTAMLKYLYVGSKSKVVSTITQTDWNKFTVKYTDGTSATNVDKTAILFNAALYTDYDYILTDATASSLTSLSGCAKRTLLKTEVTNYKPSYFNENMLITGYKCVCTDGTDVTSSIVFNSTSGKWISRDRMYKVKDVKLESVEGITSTSDIKFTLKSNYMYHLTLTSGSITRPSSGKCQFAMTDSKGTFTTPATYAYAFTGKYCLINSTMAIFVSYVSSTKRANFYNGSSFSVAMYSSFADLTSYAAYLFDNTITGHIITEAETDTLLFLNGNTYVASFRDRDYGYLRWVKLVVLDHEEYIVNFPHYNTNGTSVTPTKLTLDYNDIYEPYLPKNGIYTKFDYYDKSTGNLPRIFYREFKGQSSGSYKDNYFYDMVVPGYENRAIECYVYATMIDSTGIGREINSLKCVFVERPFWKSNLNKVICCERDYIINDTYPYGAYRDYGPDEVLDYIIQGDSHYFTSSDTLYGSNSSMYKFTRQGDSLFIDEIAFTKSQYYETDFERVYNYAAYSNPIAGESYTVYNKADITTDYIDGIRFYAFEFSGYYKYSANSTGFATTKIDNRLNTLQLFFFDRNQYILANAK